MVLDLRQKYFPFLGNHILEIIIRLKNKGLGLGLFISKNLLAKSQGEIKFSHREGGGGLVKIVLSKNYLNLSNE